MNGNENRVHTSCTWKKKLFILGMLFFLWKEKDNSDRVLQLP